MQNPAPAPNGALSDSASNLAATARSLADQASALAAQAGNNLGAAAAHGGGAGDGFLVMGLTVFVLACFVGYYVVWRVTPALHSPLMAVTNAISSVIIVGAMLATGLAISGWAMGFGFLAVTLASVNIFGGFLVTQRMLQMFRRRG